MKNALLCGGSALAVVVGLCASQAFAADASAGADAATPGMVGELVVVAQKREQSIESVPVAVTAFSAKQRQLMGINKVQDLTDFTPGLSWTDTNDRIYIRGIGRNSDNLNNTSGVAIYYNGVYYGANAAIELQKDDLFIGNIEVDNGPQNTLHGSNADGGLVQYTSQKPTNSYYAEVRAGVSNYNEYMGEAVVSGPINDHLKFRLGGNYTQMTGGYYNNLDGPPEGGNLVLGGGGQTHYLEGQLEGNWDHLDVWAMASSGEFAANSKEDGAALGDIPNNPFLLTDSLTPSGFYGLCGLPGVTGAGCGTGPTIVPGSVRTLPYTANAFPGNNPGNVNLRDFIQEYNPINEVQNNVALAFNATYHLPSVDITYLGAYQQYRNVLHFPGATDAGITSFQEEGPPGMGNLTIYPTPDYTTFNEFDHSFSHELDFTSTWNSPFQYVAGLYWYEEHWLQPVWADTTPAQSQMFHPYYATITSLSPLTLAPTTPAPFNVSGAGSTDNTGITYDSYAAFWQGSYKFNDQWKITGAVRYTEDHKAGYQEWRVVEFDSPAYGATAAQYGANTQALDITALATASAKGPYPGAGPTLINPNTGFAQRTLGASWGAWTGEADIDWTPNSSTLAYAKYSRGYKSGGFNTYTLAANPEVQPEYVDAFEVGAKKTIGSAWTLNGDAFYYNYYGMQVPVSVASSIGPVATLYNVPLVRDWGVELWGTWHPIDPLIFTLSYSYLNARIAQSACLEDTADPLAIQPGAKTAGCTETATDTKSGTLVQNVVGAQVPEATPNKVSFNTLYTLSFDPGKVTFSGSVIWKDATYASLFNRAYSLQPSYFQVNLRANWQDAQDRYNVILFCDNLFNALGYDGAAGALVADNPTTRSEDILNTLELTAPRTFGLQVQYRWK